MWILFLIMVVIGAASDRGWARPLRLDIGWVTINFFLMPVILGLGVAIFRGGHYQQQYPTLRKHPVYIWSLLLLGFATFTGIFAMAMNDNGLIQLHTLFMPVRDWVMLPMTIFIGYRMLATPRSAERFVYGLVIAGIVVAICQVVTFRERAENVNMYSDLNEVRMVQFLSDPAGLACAVVLFSIAAGVRMYRPWLAASIAAFCLVGQFAPLHRANWLACIAGIMGIFLVLRHGRRLHNLMMLSLASVALAMGLWIGMYFASRWTGWDFYAKMEYRVMTMLPTERAAGEVKAWDTRAWSAIEELKVFAGSPIIGRGFGIQDMYMVGILSGPHHNAWTDILAKLGLVGLAPALLVIGGCIVIGRKMVLQATNRGTMLLGALGVITGFYYIVHGLTTWSFNGFRSAAMLGLIFGAMLRCRAMQLTDQEVAQLTAEGVAYGQNLPALPLGADLDQSGLLPTY